MLSVYIVDDSQMMRERLMELTADITGVEIVGQSGDPFEALDSIRKAHPDVVILVIMITNYPYRQYRQGCLAAGADYFFSKIDEFEMIRDTLSRIGHHHQS